MFPTEDGSGRSARDVVALLELRKFFDHQVILEQAREDIKRGLDQREKAFLDLVRVQIYERRECVYFRLLQMAGCDFADLENHVAYNGLENTLQKLADEGVYLTSDEFRGKKELVREGRTFAVSRIDFKMPETDHRLMLLYTTISRARQTTDVSPTGLNPAKDEMTFTSPAAIGAHRDMQRQNLSSSIETRSREKA